MRLRRTMILVVAALAAAAAQQLPAAASAPHVTGLVRAISYGTGVTSGPSTTRAYCPDGKRVISGGGGVWWDKFTSPDQVVLSAMQPVHPLSGDDFYQVTGEQTQTGQSGTWNVFALAICADPIEGMHIVTTTAGPAPSSSSWQLAQPTCPDGEKVLGVGGVVIPSYGQVALQVERASTDGQLAYIGAHEDADGYAGTWNILGQAVCAPEPAGYRVAIGNSPQSASETLKSASATCTYEENLVGTGGATTFNAPGGVNLLQVQPALTIPDDHVYASAIENTPTSANWDFIVSESICVT